MIDNPVWEICERVAEVQALLDDHVAGGKRSAADVVAKAQAVLSEPELLRTMFDVGYFPPITPPLEREAACPIASGIHRRSVRTPAAA
jgi:hypothetical protein